MTAANIARNFTSYMRDMDGIGSNITTDFSIENVTSDVLKDQIQDLHIETLCMLNGSGLHSGI